jgi:hypothetical protein
MYRRDYIQRMIEEFSRVLSKAMGLWNENRREDALLELQQTYRPFFGLDYETLAGISPQAMPHLITETRPLQADQAEALASALEFEGELLKDEDVNQAIDRFNKAITIYQFLKQNDKATFSLPRLHAEERIMQRLTELKNDIKAR